MVTGPTGSGKSAVIRAMELACFNARGKSFVRHGKATARVAVGIQDEQVVVGIERGASNAYRLVTPGDGEPEVSVFTKLGGGVPEEVAGTLRMSRLNFSRQFDPPYLLTGSGADVARELGRLTNVTLLFAAAREANRRRLAIAARLKDATARLEDLSGQLEKYRNLKRQRTAMAGAEAAIAVVQAAESRLALLRSLASQLQECEQQELQVSLRAQAVLNRVPLPLVESASQAYDRLQLARRLVSDLEAAETSCRSRLALRARAGRAEEEARAEFSRVLAQAGQCPTCGQLVGDGTGVVSS